MLIHLQRSLDLKNKQKPQSDQCFKFSQGIYETPASQEIKLFHFQRNILSDLSNNYRKHYTVYIVISLTCIMIFFLQAKSILSLSIPGEQIKVRHLGIIEPGHLTLHPRLQLLI